MRRHLAVLIVLLTAPCVSAASISLFPLQSTEVVTGQAVSFDVVFDFTDVLSAGVIGGGFDISYDPTALAFDGVEFDYIGDPVFFGPPTVTDGLLESWGVGEFAGLPASGRFGTVTFVVLASMGPSTVLFGQTTSGLAGPWVCSIDFYCVIDVTYDEVVLTKVPIPTAMVLFVCALNGLASICLQGRTRD